MSRPLNSDVLVAGLRIVAFVHGAGRPVAESELIELNGWTRRNARDRLARYESVLVDQLELLALDENGQWTGAGNPPQWVRLPTADDVISQLVLCDIGLMLPGLHEHHAALSAVRDRLGSLGGRGVIADIARPAALDVLEAAADAGSAVTFEYRAVDGNVSTIDAVPSTPTFAAGEWRFDATATRSGKTYTMRADRIVGSVTEVAQEPTSIESLTSAANGKPRVNRRPRRRVSLTCVPGDVAVFDRFDPTVSRSRGRRRVELDLFEPVEELFAAAVRGCLEKVEIIEQPEGGDLSPVQSQQALAMLDDYRQRQP